MDLRWTDYSRSLRSLALRKCNEVKSFVVSVAVVLLPHWSGAAGDEVAPQEDIERFQIFDIWKLSRFGVTVIAIYLCRRCASARRSLTGACRPLAARRDRPLRCI